MVLTQSEKDQIEKQIRAAEANTSGEIVVLVQPSSGGYAWVRYASGFVGLILGTMIAYFTSHAQWSTGFWPTLEWQVAGACTGLFLSFFAPVRRMFVSNAVRKAKVHRDALASFIARGVCETRDRTGILIYVSEFERRVEIVADRGIHEKLGSQYWEKVNQRIVQGLKAKKPANAISEAVTEIGLQLSTHFPKRQDDTNELPDSVH
jgi:putative membrane protein